MAERGKGTNILLVNGVAVSGDTMLGDYIGSGGFTGSSLECLKSRDGILKDKEALTCSEHLGKRVAEMAKIVRVELLTLEKELPSEYFSEWKEI